VKKRKETIRNLKKKLKENLKSHSNLQSLIKSSKLTYEKSNKELNAFNANVRDTTNQISQIIELKGSYDQQLKSLSKLNIGSKKIIYKQQADYNSLVVTSNEIKMKVKKNEEKIKILTEKDSELKKKYQNTINENKGIEEKNK